MADLKTVPENVGEDEGTPSILLVTTCWWSTSARFLQLLQKAGCRVAVLCPNGHPVIGLGGVRVFQQNWRRPVAALSAAIAHFAPSVVVPGDDRAATILHRLYEEGSAAERSLVQRSIGPNAPYPALVSRVRLMQLAAGLNIPVPDGGTISNERDLEAWMHAVPGPWVVKISGSWSGLGVRIAQTKQEALAAYRHLRSHPKLLPALKHLLVNRDPYWMADWLCRRKPEVSVQAWVQGRRGDLAIFCQNGEVLAATMAETMVSEGANGATLVARVIEREDFRKAAVALASELGLTGFYGLDFIIEDVTERALLIELNPRLTPLTNIRGAGGRDLIGAAAQAYTGKPFLPPETVQPGGVVAYFPGSWGLGRNHAALSGAFQDVPWDEPRLMAEMLRPGWPDRQPLARFFSVCRHLLERIIRRKHPRRANSFTNIAADGFARRDGTVL